MTFVVLVSLSTQKCKTKYWLALIRDNEPKYDDMLSCEVLILLPSNVQIK